MSAPAPTNRYPRLDKYELIEELGHGGMATVYRARDLRLDREVAVKLIHKHLRENAEVRGRFVAEAKAVAKLRHPGIVDVYDVSDEDDEERYLVVELIPGTTLRKVLDEYGALPAEIAAVLTSQLCDAAEHAHNAGVIHRDIKPENVLVDIAPAMERASSPRDGSAASGRGRVTVKLTDFGIAKVLDAQGVTSTGQILGSPAHMAPEQIEGGEIAATTDVFALGVLFYACMVGHLPFHGTNPAQVLRKVLLGEFHAADLERAEIGGRWARLVAKALELDPAKRYPSALTFAQAIADELHSLGFEDHERRLQEFFVEPAAFREQLATALVPRLVARGECARRAGDVQGAAADFNRALALHPDDLAILKRVSSLSAQRVWGRRLSRVGALAGGALLLGGSAFLVARAVKGRAEEAARPVYSLDLEFPDSRVPTALPVQIKTLQAVAPPSATNSARFPQFSGNTVPTGGAVRAAVETHQSRTTRQVRVTVVPAGAKLQIDGVEVAWFGVLQPLGVGVHTLVGLMPGENPCCSPATATLNVSAPPLEEPDQIQPFTLALGFKDAQMSLSGGPPDARVTCDNGLVFGAGASGTVKMADIQRRTMCVFTPGNKHQSVTLSAGVPASVPWPG